MSYPHTPISRRAVLSLPLLAALPRPAHAEITVVDVLGRTHTLGRPAERVVVGFYADEYSAIAGPGGWDRVVGFSKRQWAVNRTGIWAKYVAAVPRLAGLPDVGAWEDQSFSGEKVLSLAPDLLIVPAWALAAHAAQIAPVEAAGIPILAVDYNAQSPDKHVASTLAIGAAIGADRRAHELASLYRAKLEDIQARVRRAGRKPKVYVESGMGGPDVVGNTYKNTMWGRMLDLVGADNIANDAVPAATGFLPMAAEKVLAAGPDFIFMTGSSWDRQPNAVRLGYEVSIEEMRASLRPYLARAGWDSLPAVRTGQVHAIENTLTRSLMDWIAMQYIAKQLYPAELADVDPVESLRAYHERYLPIAFSGTWMGKLTP